MVWNLDLKVILTWVGPHIASLKDDLQFLSFGTLVKYTCIHTSNKFLLSFYTEPHADLQDQNRTSTSPDWAIIFSNTFIIPSFREPEIANMF